MYIKGISCYQIAIPNPLTCAPCYRGLSHLFRDAFVIRNLYFQYNNTFHNALSVRLLVLSSTFRRA